MVIAEGLVSLNGQIETQKRKKIYSGDCIEFNQIKYTIKINDGTAIDWKILSLKTNPKES